MKNKIRYVHTNIIAKDWKKLAQFYMEALDCRITYPERDLSGEWIDKLTEINNVSVKGVHLLLPGYENGPTLEIFSYFPEDLRDNIPSISRQGLGHLAFHVEDVNKTLQIVIEHGGEKFGEVVEKEYPGLGTVTVIYVRDPEGNFIELQNWRKN